MSSSTDPPVPPEEHPPRSHGRQASAAVIGVLTLLLGFAIAVQVHANSTGDALSGLSQTDLIGILDNQDDRATRLRQEIAQLQQQLRELHGAGSRTRAARRQAQQESDALGVLLGTVPATGPGVVVTVTDPGRQLSGEDLLDLVEELRGAGAEAIQFGPVRVSTDTAFTGAAGAVRVDDRSVAAPYRVVAIGDPKTLTTALNIPGGVAATVRTAGGTLHSAEHRTVTIRVTRALPSQQYVQPGH